MKFKIFCCLVIIFITLFMPSYIYAYDTTLENKDYIIFIDINELSLSLLDKETKILVKKYPVAIGKKETPSPIGNWRITSKAWSLWWILVRSKCSLGYFWNTWH